MIQVESFHKSYRSTVAVHDLSFEVHPGEILGLLGPNGAGKTSTLRALAGIIPPTRGRLRVGGHDVVADPIAAKRELAYVADDPPLFESLTTWEHLAFMAAAYRVADVAAKGAALLEQFELTGQRDTLVQELSRGMRQKVAICCAYLHDPKAVLLDEPLTGLDPHGIRVMKDSVVARARAGTAFVVSSHLLALIEDLCTSVLILHRGQRLFFGRVAEARRAFQGLADDASLEEVFFRATSG